MKLSDNYFTYLKIGGQQSGYMVSRAFTWGLKQELSSSVVEMGDRLATIDMGRNVGAAVPLSVAGGGGLHLTQCGLGRGLPPYQVASWSTQPRFGTVHQRCKTDRQTYKQRTDSIGRTVLQTVAPKWECPFGTIAIAVEDRQKRAYHLYCSLRYATWSA